MNCCKFSRDNSLLATGGEDCKVRIYELDIKDYKSSKMIFELEGHYEPINGVDISPDKKFAISSSSDRSCLIYNLEKRGQRI